MCEQLQAAFINSFVNNGAAMHLHEFKGQEILITTYQEVIKTKFDLGVVDIVICNDAKCLFSYTVANTLKDGYTGYFSERDFTQKL